MELVEEEGKEKTSKEDLQKEVEKSPKKDIKRGSEKSPKKDLKESEKEKEKPKKEPEATEESLSSVSRQSADKKSDFRSKKQKSKFLLIEDKKEEKKELKETGIKKFTRGAYLYEDRADKTTVAIAETTCIVFHFQNLQKIKDVISGEKREGVSKRQTLRLSTYVS